MASLTCKLKTLSVFDGARQDMASQGSALGDLDLKEREHELA